MTLTFQKSTKVESIQIAEKIALCTPSGKFMTFVFWVSAKDVGILV